MNPRLDDENYSVDERLESAKILLSMKDKEIAKLKERLSKVESDHSWEIDQSGYHTMATHQEILEECDRWLLSLLGSKDLAERWWQGPNAAFEMRAPAVAFQEAPKVVRNYLRQF